MVCLVSNELPVEIAGDEYRNEDDIVMVLEKIILSFFCV
jgi:hypothetical protein